MMTYWIKIFNCYQNAFHFFTIFYLIQPQIYAILNNPSARFFCTLTDSCFIVFDVRKVDHSLLVLLIWCHDVRHSIFGIIVLLLLYHFFCSHVYNVYRVKKSWHWYYDVHSSFWFSLLGYKCHRTMISIIQKILYHYKFILS